MDARPTGIVVYRASRLEALLEPLEGLLQKYPPRHLLGAQTVLAAHPGMKRWLSLALARRRGPRSIVANLDVRLPTSWFESRVRDELHVSAIALEPYRREALCWRIHELMPTVDDPTVRRYLEGNDPRRRFQLADRVAAIFSRYMVYRPDWLSDWQAGRDYVPEPNFLAPLWRRLRADIGQPHRGELIAQLIERRLRAAPTTAAEPVHVFGLSHLPPSELAVLRAESRHRLVVMYVPDPSIEFWAGLGNETGRIDHMLKLGLGDDSERELLSIGHPLLAAWGRMGHHFGLRLREGSSDVLLETRHGEDRAWAPESEALLHRVQQSIRQMTDEPLPSSVLTADKARADESLRIHGCHTRVRELEVLHDAIRAALAADPDLHPSDILVMSPTMPDYALLLPSVFGSGRKTHRGLPYHLADVSVRRTHEMFDAFAVLVATPGSRVTAPQVLDLMQVPAIGRALGIESAGLARLREWLSDARVAWGLDAASRARLGLPAFPEYSFAWGMDRLLAGYIYGEGVAEVAAQQTRIWPVVGVTGMEVDAIGAMDRLLGFIEDFVAFSGTPRPLSAWRTKLGSVLAQLFRADDEQPLELEALNALQVMIESLCQGTIPELDPSVDFAVVRDLIDERLDAVPERQPFLIGGITFSGMVPQRSIPFRMIALLGMNDGDFPRAGSDGGIDLMSRHRRLGDRDVRNDDRFLFLETVMAARSRLHLSFLSEGVRDGKPRNPSAPLAELMAYLDDRAGFDRDHEKQPRPWFVQHPLQPFDARYFDGSDPRLFTYEQRFARMVRGNDAGDARFAPPASPHVIQDIEDAMRSVERIPAKLAQVRAYLKRPAESCLKQQLNVRIDAMADDALSDTEPLNAKFSALDRVPRMLVFDALFDGRFDVPMNPPDRLRLSGQMPPGVLGECAYESARELAQRALDMVRDDPELISGLNVRQVVDLSQRIGAFDLDGVSSPLHVCGNALVLLDAYPDKSDATLGLRDRSSIFLEWALLRLKYPERVIRVLLLTAPHEKKSETELRFDAQLNGPGYACGIEELSRRVETLLGLWHHAQQETAWYFPSTSNALAKAKPGEDMKKARESWEGEYAERDQQPPYAAMLTRGVDLFSGDDWANLRGVANLLNECITFEIAPAEDDHE